MSSNLSQPRRSALLASFGTLIEYYDYALYGFLATTLAHNFFPSSNKAALLHTFLIYSSAYLVKILGALVFGRLSDRQGRARALKISLIGIALPTCLMGLLPTYDQLGSLSPILLLTLRATQGFFVGGEYDTASVYLYEKIGAHYPNLANSCLCLSASLGIALASTLCHWQAQLNHMDAWRIPFLLGGLAGLACALLRRNLTETVAFVRAQQGSQKTADLEWSEVAVSLLICGVNGATYQFFFVYLPTQLGALINYSSQPIPTFLGWYIVLTPLAGFCADKIQAKRCLQLATTSLIILLLCFLLSPDTYRLPILWAIITVLPFFHVPGTVYLLSRFAITNRSRTLSLGHSLGSAFLSGSLPALCLYLQHTTHFWQMPWVYLTGLCTACLMLFIFYRGTSYG